MRNKAWNTARRTPAGSHRWIAAIAAIAAAAALAVACIPERFPPHVYLTWDSADTSTRMLVHLHTPRAKSDVILRYGPSAGLSAEATAADFPLSQPSVSEDLAALKRRVHTFSLRGLTPDTSYQFAAFLPDGTALTGAKRFHTLPADGSPLRFVAGGDSYPNEALAELHRQAARRNPMFALIGGDIAYDDGKLMRADRWDYWLGAWEREMVTSDGHLVPMVLAIGNHELPVGYGGRLNDAIFYTRYFRQNAEAGVAYFRRDFGSRVSVLALDSGHTASHDGPQAEWLRDELGAMQDRPFRFALYHVPLYPSVRGEEGDLTQAGRRHWGPLFDLFRLTIAFENHDHALKRTHPLREGRVDAERGVVYLGDGCWGKGARDVARPLRGYLAHAESSQHVWVAETGAEGVRLEAIDRRGQVLDSVAVPTSPSRATPHR
jgi:hypothetical protein